MKFRSSLDKYRRGKIKAPGTKTFTVVIDSLSNEGDGVTRIDGKVMFVPHTTPGDKVEVTVTENRARLIRAQVTKLLKPSPHRVTPECKWVEQCGGCAWQHIAYEHQLLVKQAQLAQTLKRIGHLPDVEIRDIGPSPTAYAIGIGFVV